MVSVTNLADRNRRWDLLAALPISNLAAELLANRNLLSALAGPSIALTMEAEGGAQAVRLTGEDLTRLLVNLVKNAAEAMPKGGRVHIGLRGREAAQGTAPCLALTIEDNGPGIPEAAFDKIFTSGYTSRGKEMKSQRRSGAGLQLAAKPSRVGAGHRALHCRRRGRAHHGLEPEAGRGLLHPRAPGAQGRDSRGVWGVSVSVSAPNRHTRTHTRTRPRTPETCN